MSSGTAVDVVSRFVEAIIWGEHLTVWELLSPAGRDHVLAAGGRRGLDVVQAERIRQGTCSPDELDLFLTGLVHGLRVDFSSVTLDDVGPAGEVIDLADGRVEVHLECPSTFGSAWAAGSMVLSAAGRSWLVDRVHPVVSRGD